MDKNNHPLSLSNILAGIIVTVIGSLIFAIVWDFVSKKNTSSDLPTPLPISSITATIDLPTSVPTITETPVPVPRVSNFEVCLDPCDGTNAMRIFPEKTNKLYVKWDFENIPFGSHYVRTWTMEGQEWVKSDCIWQGAESGTSSITLREPSGLHSGTWEMTIVVNDEILLQEQIVIQGDWDFWGTVGVRGTCFDDAP